MTLSMAHRKIDLSQCSAAEAQSLSKSCTLALRSNIARSVTEMNHREFCIRLADSALWQWFLQIGRVDGVSTFAKSTSDRFARFIDAQSLQVLKAKVIHWLQGDTQADFGSEKTTMGSSSTIFWRKKRPATLSKSTPRSLDWSKSNRYRSRAFGATADCTAQQTRRS